MLLSAQIMIVIDVRIPKIIEGDSSAQSINAGHDVNYVPGVASGAEFLHARRLIIGLLLTANKTEEHRLKRKAATEIVVASMVAPGEARSHGAKQQQRGTDFSRKVL